MQIKSSNLNNFKCLFNIQLIRKEQLTYLAHIISANIITQRTSFLNNVASKQYMEKKVELWLNSKQPNEIAAAFKECTVKFTHENEP